MNFAANRRKLGLAFGACIAAVLALGLTVSGAFRADVQTKRGLFGPVRLGVEGGIGEAAGVSAPAADAGQLPEQDSGQDLIVSSGGSYPVTVTTAPYHGPTDEERALLHQLRAAAQAAYARQAARLSPEERELLPQPTDMRLPPRHLSKDEKAQMRAAIQALKAPL